MCNPTKVATVRQKVVIWCPKNKLQSPVWIPHLFLLLTRLKRSDNKLLRSGIRRWRRWQHANVELQPSFCCSGLSTNRYRAEAAGSGSGSNTLPDYSEWKREDMEGQKRQSGKRNKPHDSLLSSWNADDEDRWCTSGSWVNQSFTPSLFASPEIKDFFYNSELNLQIITVKLNITAWNCMPGDERLHIYSC